MIATHNVVAACIINTVSSKLIAAARKLAAATPKSVPDANPINELRWKMEVNSDRGETTLRATDMIIRPIMLIEIASIANGGINSPNTKAANIAVCAGSVRE